MADSNFRKRSIKEDQIVFEPSYVQPDPTNDLLEEMKSFSIENESKKKSPERKGGILKPQGSLERSREERELLSSVDLKSESSSNSVTTNSGNKVEIAKMKRLKQNVALQSIFKKMEESKQVKFSMDEDNIKEKDKEKSVKFDKKAPIKPPLTTMTNNQFNSPPLRTQSFNQNHPGFTGKHDFLNNLHNISINSDLDKNVNIPFSQHEPLTSLNTSMITYNPQTNSSLFSPTIQNKPSVFTPNMPPSQFTSQPQFNPSQPPPPLPSVPINPSQYNVWKHDDVPLQNPWWQNSSSPNQGPPVLLPNQNSVPPPNLINTSIPPPTHSSLNHQLPPPPSRPSIHPSVQTGMSQNPSFRSPDPFTSNSFLYPNMRSNVQPPYMQSSAGEYSKVRNQVGSEMYNSPWSYTQSVFGGEGSMMNFDSTNRGISMRQAMLKEGNNVTPPSRVPDQSEKYVQNQANMSAYSLFNTNSWTPNLASQLRSPSTSEPQISQSSQHSLFSNHGPQSLTQLLEQQNKLHKNDK